MSATAWIYDEENIGRCVRFYFPEIGIIDGTVAAYLPPHENSGEALWYVQWYKEETNPVQITFDELQQGLQTYYQQTDNFDGAGINIDENSLFNTNKEDYEVLWEDGRYDNELNDNYNDNNFADDNFENVAGAHFGFAGSLRLADESVDPMVTMTNRLYASDYGSPRSPFISSFGMGSPYTYDQYNSAFVASPSPYPKSRPSHFSPLAGTIHKFGHSPATTLLLLSFSTRRKTQYSLPLSIEPFLIFLIFYRPSLYHT